MFHFFRRPTRSSLIVMIALSLPFPLLAQAPPPQPLSADQRHALETQRKRQQTDLERFKHLTEFADAAIFAKGLEWALRYDREFSEADVKLLQQAVTRGEQRLAALADRQAKWASQRGKLALGYVSRVDGSVQPYGLIVSQDYDPERPNRLDVVLHGSTRPVGLSELRFLTRFDAGDGPQADLPSQPYLELHPLGRVENCYRWAGETDVFEAIDDVCRRFSIDRDRIVLRGMSMGASGTWHLGLKHPDLFVVIGPYCGYVDTHKFSETPLPNFVKVGPLPVHQELGLHMLDSVDYAANAGVVPAVACMGENDVFFQAHVLMSEAMQREGLTMVNLISPGTGHVIDPVTHAEQLRRIAELAQPGINHRPASLRFVTWTLKYSRCHWLQVLGLERHYARAEFSAAFHDDVLEIAEPRNITRFAIRTAELPQWPRAVRIGTAELPLPASITAQSPGVVFLRHDGKWKVAGEFGRVALPGKRPGLQGPIDDAFTGPFLCVRGTGVPWNPGVQAYCEASLQRFTEEWKHYFRGDLPIKNDTDVTDEDLQSRHLILFGDPGSNRWIGKLQPQFPMTWSQDAVHVQGKDYAASDHLPAFIMPNPLAQGESRYVVVNSGHTFREAELAKLNYLLFPRWGDWAVLRIDPQRADTEPCVEEVLRAGYFDEGWKLP